MDMTTSPDTALNLIRQTARQTGINLPPALTRDLERAQKTVTRGLPTVDRPALQQRLLKHLEAGTDPLDDKDVQRNALLLALETIRPGALIEQHAEMTRAAALRKHAPVIIEAWSTAVEAAGAPIAKAKQQLPNVDLMNAAVVAGLPVDRVAVWGEAREALARIDKITQTWPVLAAAIGGPRVGTGENPLIIAALTLEQVDALRVRTAVAAAQAGHSLKLASFEEFRERVADVTAARAKRQAMTEQARLDSVRL